MYNTKMLKVKKFFKRFGTDIAGYLCLILVLPIGALPGPGGIPLLVAGLGLLSVHNAWAKSLLDYVKKHSSSLRNIFFPHRKNIELSWDIFAVCMFISAFIVSIFIDFWFFKALGTAMGAVSTTIFMFNRARLERLQKRFKKQ